MVVQQQTLSILTQVNRLLKSQKTFYFTITFIFFVLFRFMGYRVIYFKEFQQFHVKGQHSKIKLVLAWCQVSGKEIYCVNVIRSSTSMSDLILFVRLAKEKNESLHKKETPAV